MALTFCQVRAILQIFKLNRPSGSACEYQCRNISGFKNPLSIDRYQLFLCFESIINRSLPIVLIVAGC